MGETKIEKHENFIRNVLLLGIVLSLLLFDFGEAAAKLSWLEGWQARRLYLLHCAGCHGKEGKGDGPAALFLYPRPRNFTRGEWKFGGRPEDIETTIAQGVPGTSMPPFDGVLSVEEMKKIALWIKRWDNTKNPPPAPSLPTGKGNVENGRKLFQKNCALCHGPNGEGDGPSAATLSDSMGFPIRPRNLRRDLLKGGEGLAAVYRRIFEGIPGTPMPAFKDSLSESEIFDIATFVVSLRPEKAVLKTFALKPARVSSEKLFVQDEKWKDVSELEVPLAATWEGKDGPHALKIQVALKPQSTVFRLEWKDPTHNTFGGKVETFGDQAAIFLPGKDGSASFYAMGHEKAPVQIWSFRALTQNQPTSEELRDAAAWEEKLFPAPARYLKNPVSKPSTEKGSFQAYTAAGVGTLTPISDEKFPLKGEALWKEGKWQVLFEGPRVLKKPSYFAFAVWDGAAGERNGRKRISPWVKLEVDHE